MHCGICHKELRHCDCPDVDERLRRVAYDPHSICLSYWCLVCDRHEERCSCNTPNHVTMAKGEPESLIQDKERVV